MLQDAAAPLALLASRVIHYWFFWPIYMLAAVIGPKMLTSRAASSSIVGSSNFSACLGRHVIISLDEMTAMLPRIPRRFHWRLSFDIYKFSRFARYRYNAQMPHATSDCPLEARTSFCRRHDITISLLRCRTASATWATRTIAARFGQPLLGDARDIGLPSLIAGRAS